jgi:polysaccharide export outer membrane protein
MIFVLFSSCANQKQIAYFQKGNQPDTINLPKAYIPKIQSGDILSITIGSLNPLASGFFNPFSTSPVSTDNSSGIGTDISASGATSSSMGTAPGFLVDSAGTIELPIVGTIKLSGLTTSEAREIIKSKLNTYLKGPTVNVRFLNYKISVMGEVSHPSVYVIPNETITLPEALSMAGDLTIFGRRDNILVIRDNNGKKEFGVINLTTRDLYSSPYYYLHANDVVYVEPGKQKIAQTDKAYQIIPIILSVASLLVIILEYSRR